MAQNKYKSKHNQDPTLFFFSLCFRLYLCLSPPYGSKNDLLPNHEDLIFYLPSIIAIDLGLSRNIDR